MPIHIFLGLPKKFFWLRPCMKLYIYQTAMKRGLNWRCKREVYLFGTEAIHFKGIQGWEPFLRPCFPRVWWGRMEYSYFHIPYNSYSYFKLQSWLKAWLSTLLSSSYFVHLALCNYVVTIECQFVSTRLGGHGSIRSFWLIVHALSSVNVIYTTLRPWYLSSKHVWQYEANKSAW